MKQIVNAHYNNSDLMSCVYIQRTTQCGCIIDHYTQSRNR